MHQLIHTAGTNRIEYQSGRREIVALELCIINAPDLRLQHHYSTRLRKMRLPGSGFGQIHTLGHYIRMHATQHLDIGSMLVEDDDMGIALRLQTRDKILADEAGAADEAPQRVTQAADANTVDVQAKEKKDA